MHLAANPFDGLGEFDRDLNVVPAIASKWKITRNYNTCTFQLRKGVKFHNGREVGAEDFIHSFSRILHPNPESPVTPLFLNMRGAKGFNEEKSNGVSGMFAPDPNTLTIEPGEPFAPFLSVLAMINAKVLAKKVLRKELHKRADRHRTIAFSLIGAGKSDRF